MDEHSYFACSATSESTVRFFLWYSNDIDGIILDETKVRTFASRQALAEFCAENGLQLSEQPTAAYDFDTLDLWIANPTAGELEIDRLLNAWNMMDDYYHSLGLSGAISDDDLDLHEKLSLSSFAISMPELLTKGRQYDPKWTESDRHRIALILHEATAKFKAAL